MDELYEGAATLQDMLGYAQKHPTLLIEVLENSRWTLLYVRWPLFFTLYST